MKKALLLIAALVVLLIAGFYAFNAYIYAEKQEPAVVDRYRATLSGEVVCLPHADTDGPQTMECAIGLKTDTGEYYALDFALMSQQHEPVNTGERLTANGTVTPLEMLSSDHWQRYAIEGIFSVTDSLEKE